MTTVHARWLALSLSAIACRGAPARDAWRDPSPHTVRFLQVSPGTRLETLDWGGHGPAIVLLSGLGNSAHVFDTFAPRLTDRFHVLGITRRGFGASTPPPAADVQTLVADVATVLDSLGLRRVVLIGHSIAGDELTAFAAAHPDRVAALVYLDAAYDRSRLLEQLRATPIPAQPPMSAADSASPATVEAYTARMFGVTMPPGEIRAVTRFDSTGRFAGTVTSGAASGALLAHLAPPAYAQVKCPALAIYAASDSARQLIPYSAALDSAGRAAAQRVSSSIARLRVSSVEQFRRGVPNGEVLEIAGANHYVFISNEAETLRAVRAFLARSVRDALPGT